MAPEDCWAVVGLALLGAVWTWAAASPDDFLIGGKCLRDGRCRLQFTECVNNVCMCTANFVSNKKKERCLKKAQLNDHCEEDVQCPVEHSACKKVQRACDCRRGYVQSQDKRECLPVAYLGDSCEEDLQCQDLTECRQRDKRCICHGIAYERDGHCVTDHSGSLQTQTSSKQAGEESDCASHQLSSGLLSGILVILYIIRAW